MSYTSDEHNERLSETGPTLPIVDLDGSLDQQFRSHKPAPEKKQYRQHSERTLSAKEAFQISLGLGIPSTEYTSSLEDVLFDLSSQDWTKRVGAVRALEVLGMHTPQRAIRALCGALRDASEEVRAAAAQALGTLEERAPKVALVLAAGDSSWKVRASVVQALGNLGEHAPIEVLLYALQKDEDAAVRSAAVSALGRLQRPEFAEILQGALWDDDPWVRQGAIQALARLNDQISPGTLAAILTDEDEEVRMEALKALGKQKQVSLGIFITALRDEATAIRLKALEMLNERIGTRLPLEQILLLLKDSSEAVRTQASKILGRCEPFLPFQVSERFLLELINDDSERLRTVAAWALGTRRERSAHSALIAALQDASSTVQQTASWALRELEQPEPTQALAPISTNPSESVQTQRSITCLLDALAAFLKDKRGFVKPELHSISNERVLILICGYEKEGYSLQEEMMSRLMNCASIEPIENALKQGNETVQVVVDHLLQTLKNRAWTELCIVSLDIKQHEQLIQEIPIPTRIVLCYISCPKVRKDDEFVLGQIVSTFEKESICAYSQKLSNQQGEETLADLSQKPEVFSSQFTLYEKPDTKRLGRALKSCRLWYAAPVDPSILALRGGQTSSLQACL